MKSLSKLFLIIGVLTGTLTYSVAMDFNNSFEDIRKGRRVCLNMLAVLDSLNDTKKRKIELKFILKKESKKIDSLYNLGSKEQILKAFKKEIKLKERYLDLTHFMSDEVLKAVCMLIEVSKGKSLATIEMLSKENIQELDRILREHFVKLVIKCVTHKNSSIQTAFKEKHQTINLE